PATAAARRDSDRAWSWAMAVLAMLAPVRSGGPFAGPAYDVAAVAARASRSSDSGSSGAERLPGAVLQWLPSLIGSGVLCPSPSPLRVSPGVTPGSLTPPRGARLALASLSVHRGRLKPDGIRPMFLRSLVENDYHNGIHFQLL